MAICFPSGLNANETSDLRIGGEPSGEALIPSSTGCPLPSAFQIRPTPLEDAAILLLSGLNAIGPVAGASTTGRPVPSEFHARATPSCETKRTFFPSGLNMAW